jgi:hypothetical protein
MPERTTQEKKCGIYEMDWATLLNNPWRTSFSNNASTIGAGNPNMMLKPLMSTVFFNILRKSGDWKNKNLKYSNPTHSLPQIPRIGLKSLKAI